MSKDYLYPDLSVPQAQQIEVMRRLHKEHQDYFTDSPYPEAIERYFRSWFDSPLGTTESANDPRVDALTGANKWEELYREVVDLYASLKSAKPSSGDSAESMAYYRTATGLLDKLVSHQERCLGIKQIHEFHSVMIDIMETTLNEDQRNAVMERLKKAITPQ